MADDDAAHRRRDHRLSAGIAHFLGERRADTHGDRGLLQQECALEKLPAVQPGAQDEVPFEERVSLPEK